MLRGLIAGVMLVIILVVLGQSGLNAYTQCLHSHSADTCHDTIE